MAPPLDSPKEFHIQEPVMMCHTEDSNFWAHGWQDKRKFKGRVLSEGGLWDLGYEPRDIFVGKVKHGWIISVAGDTSGCGWDTTMYFQEDEPTVYVDGDDRYTDVATTYESMCKNHGVDWGTKTDHFNKNGHDWDTMKEEDCSEEEHDAIVVDGPHKVTWWEPA